MKLAYYNNFRKLLIQSESEGNYNADNGIAFGLYQFTKSRIKAVAEYIGEAVPSIQQFKADRTMQDRFFVFHIEMILKYLYEKTNLAERFEGKLIKGKNKYQKEVPLNVYGMIAAAHLGGETGLKNFLESNVDRKDKFGTYISDYAAKFSDLMSESITAEKKKSIVA